MASFLSNYKSYPQYLARYFCSGPGIFLSHKSLRRNSAKVYPDTTGSGQSTRIRPKYPYTAGSGQRTRIRSDSINIPGYGRIQTRYPDTTGFEKSIRISTNSSQEPIKSTRIRPDPKPWPPPCRAPYTPGNRQHSSPI